MKRMLKFAAIIFALTLIFALPMSAEEYKTGDMNGDGVVNTDDAIYLLRYVLQPEKYELACNHNLITEEESEATCTQAGSSRTYCARCAYEKREEIPAVGHNYINGKCYFCGIEDTENLYSQGLEFSSNGDGTCYISGIGTCVDTDIKIPEISPNGDKVTSIGSYAFDNCDSLTSVTIPDSVTSIGDYAFQNCIALAYMHIPVTITSIASYAFLGADELVISCEATTKQTYWQQDWDYSVSKVYWGVTDNSTELSFFYNEQGYVVDKYNGDADIIIVPSAYDDGKNGMAPVIGIYDYAFYQSDIVAVTIPSTINYIGESAFKECDNLIAVILDMGLVNIGNHAFSGCSVLQSATIPTTVMTIGERAFQYSGIKTLNILTNSADMGPWVFLGCENLANVTIAEGTTRIYHGQFESCDSLEKIILPDTMVILDYEAFMNCSNLKSVIIPKTVTQIRNWAFHRCPETLVISYQGKKSDWRNISIGTNNDSLYSCTIICNE